MSKFNIGDKVKSLGTERIGRITSIFIYAGEPTKYIIDGIYTTIEGEIEKVTPVTKMPKFDIGDIVRSTYTGVKGTIIRITFEQGKDTLYKLDNYLETTENALEKVAPVTKKDLLDTINDRRFGVFERMEELVKRILADGYEG